MCYYLDFILYHFFVLMEVYCNYQNCAGQKMGTFFYYRVHDILDVQHWFAGLLHSTVYKDKVERKKKHKRRLISTRSIFLFLKWHYYLWEKLKLYFKSLTSFLFLPANPSMVHFGFISQTTFQKVPQIFYLNVITILGNYMALISIL